MAFTLQYDFKVLDQFSGPVRRMSEAMRQQKEALKNTTSRLDRYSAKLRSTGAALANFRTAAGAAAAGMALKGVISTLNNYETAMNGVKAVTGATPEAMKSLRAEARHLGAVTQFSAVQVAGGMEKLGMAGLKTNDILKVMPGMLDLAAAGQLELSSASDIATNVLAMYQLPLSRIGHLSDVLALGASSANTSVEEMAEGIKNAGATAHMAGLTLEQTSAALMILANNGIKGGEAGTQLMNMLKSLMNLTPKATKALKRVGINPKSLVDAKGHIKDFGGLLKQLHDKKVSQKLFDIFDIRGAKAAAVLKQTGKDAYDAFVKLGEGADGAAKKMSGIRMEGLPGMIKRLASAWEGVVLVLGRSLLPVIVPVGEYLSNLLGDLQKNHPWLLKMAAGGLALFAALGMVIVPLGIMASSLGAVLSVAGPVLGLIGKMRIAMLGFNAVVAANPIGFIITLVAGLVAWFGVLYARTGSVKLALMKMGQVILNVLYWPLRKFLDLLSGIASIIPGLGGVSKKLQGFKKNFEFDFADKAIKAQKKVAESIKPVATIITDKTKNDDLYGQYLKNKIDKQESLSMANVNQALKSGARTQTGNQAIESNITLNAGKGTNVGSASVSTNGADTGEVFTDAGY